MADQKISQLTAATTPLAGTEVLPIVQAGSTKKVSVADLTAGRAISALSMETGNATTGLTIVDNDVTADGTDTNIDLDLNPKGSGAVQVKSTQTGKIIVSSAQNAGIAYSVVSSHATDSASLQSCFGNNAAAQTSYSTNLTRVDTGKSAWGWQSLVLIGAFEDQSYMRLSYVSAAGVQSAAIDVDYVGNVKVSTGNLVIGTSGKGIDFSATSQPAGMTSELLDDYEEGTWTPAFSASGLSGITYGTFIGGTYTKVGDTVTAWFTLYTFGTFTKGASTLTITGLPFAAIALDGWGTGAVFGNLTRFDANPPIAGRLDSAATTIALYSNIRVTGSGADPTAVSSADMRSADGENNNFVQGYITYKTA
jgi:hypothetical protein